MDWQDELQMERIEREEKIEEAFEIVVSNLSKEEIRELAQELLRFAGLPPIPGLLGD